MHYIGIIFSGYRRAWWWWLVVYEHNMEIDSKKVDGTFSLLGFDGFRE